MEARFMTHNEIKWTKLSYTPHPVGHMELPLLLIYSVFRATSQNSSEYWLLLWEVDLEPLTNENRLQFRRQKVWPECIRSNYLSLMIILEFHY